jgi:HSP20 family protein
MALWNWDSFREWESFRREMDRTVRGRNPFFRVAFLPGRAARQYPMINLNEDANAYYVEALAPGVDPQSLDVTVVHNSLTIAGEKKPGNGEAAAEAFHRNERAAGRFVRTIDLPSEVDGEHIQADYKNGLLLITLPKAEQTKPRQVSVNVA